MACGKKFHARQLAEDSPEPKYIRIFRQLKDYIKSSAGRDYGRIPGELELARDFGVSRKSVGKAMQMLTRERLVCRIKKRGTFLLSNISPSDPQSPIQKIGIVFPQANDAWQSLIAAMEKTAAELGYRTMLKFYASPQITDEAKIIHEITQKCDGAVFYPNVSIIDDPVFKKLIQQHYPMVLFDVCNPAFVCNSVYVDHLLGGYLLTEKLISNGFRRPGMVRSENDFLSSRFRYEGYRDALKEYGIEFSDEMLFRVREQYNNAEFLHYLESSGVDCLVLVSQNLSNGFRVNHPQITSHLIRKGIPVASFDISQEVLDSSPLFVASIRQPMTEMGQSLITLLAQSLKSPHDHARKIAIAPDIIFKTAERVENYPTHE